jgi:predicted transposase/invertase (TIGR01784 family)
LIAFLNELFKGRKIIKDLVYNQQENNGPLQHYRKTIFDLTCTGADGETFIIEMQKAEQKFFTDRAIFYTCSKLYEQGQKGNRYWDFELKEVYFIALMDFNFDSTPSEKYLYRVRLAEEETGETFYNKLGFIFLELPNFNLKEEEIKTNLEGWMYVLRNMAKMEKIPVILHKRIFQKLFHIAEVANLKKEEYMLYEKALLDKWTEYAVKKTAAEKIKNAKEEIKIAKEEIKTAKEETKTAKEEAKKAMKEGMEKGIEKGKEQFVKNLIRNFGFSDEQAAGAAEVSIDLVKKIRTSLKKKK